MILWKVLWDDAHGDEVTNATSRPYFARRIMGEDLGASVKAAPCPSKVHGPSSRSLLIATLDPASAVVSLMCKLCVP